jgi:hypothetical protein
MVMLDRGADKEAFQETIREIVYGLAVTVAHSRRLLVTFGSDCWTYVAALCRHHHGCWLHPLEAQALGRGGVSLI